MREHTGSICFAHYCFPIARDLVAAQQTLDLFMVELDPRRMMRRNLKWGSVFTRLHWILSVVWGGERIAVGWGHVWGFFGVAGMLGGPGRNLGQGCCIWWVWRFLRQKHRRMPSLQGPGWIYFDLEQEFISLVVGCPGEPPYRQGCMLGRGFPGSVDSQGSQNSLLYRAHFLP